MRINREGMTHKANDNHIEDTMFAFCKEKSGRRNAYRNITSVMTNPYSHK